jgi:hypothetical protein
LGVTACSGAGDKSTGADLFVGYYEELPGAVGGDSALLQGRISIQDGCVYVIREGTGELIVPVFEEGSVEIEEASSRAGFAFQGERYGDGSNVAFTGGEGEIELVNELPDRCLEGGLWAVA